MTTPDDLSGCAAASEMSQEERLALLEVSATAQVAANEHLIREGDRASDFFVLLSGTVLVLKGDQEIAALDAGSIFGEMALFNDDVRTSSVVTAETCTVLRVPAGRFSRDVLHQHPYAVRLMAAMGRLMVERLQDYDNQLVAAAQQEDGELSARTERFSRLKANLLHEWSLRYHSIGLPGKLATVATKPVGTTADLSVAYSPGVADPCLAIADDPEKAYEYTACGHLVGVVTNGTAVLGLGDIGPLAAKPVMEGKAVLFKRFADLDAFDIEVNERDPERLIDVVCAIAPTFGGINLEDIKAPECFHIERACQERLDIPVFHDDQHGTAIIAGAGLLNALQLTGKEISRVRVVFCGAGAAGFATAKHFVALGVQKENLILTDIGGVVYGGREGNGYLEELASDTETRTLAEALEGADIFVGVSVGGILSPTMLSSMARDPIVFALANPTPEISYNLARQTRSDVIMATGRSDYPNQINNVIAFPYIFRGALDVRARAVNETIKIATTRAIAALAQAPVPPEVMADSPGLTFGPDYIIPKPFDPRLRVELPVAIAAAAMETGLARKPVDLDAYRRHLESSVSRPE